MLEVTLRTPRAYDSHPALAWWRRSSALERCSTDGALGGGRGGSQFLGLARHLAEASMAADRSSAALARRRHGVGGDGAARARLRTVEVLPAEGDRRRVEHLKSLALPLPRLEVRPTGGTDRMGKVAIWRSQRRSASVTWVASGDAVAAERLGRGSRSWREAANLARPAEARTNASGSSGRCLLCRHARA